MPLVVSAATTQADFFELIRLREEVFVLEQGIPLGIELDDDDAVALHLVAREGTEVVGTARLVMRAQTGKIGRMAVKRHHRGRQIGRALMAELLRAARAKGLTSLLLHAQEPAVPFYQKMGFLVNGTPFTEGGIPHHRMVRAVTSESLR